MADKVLPRQGKAKGIQHHQAIITSNVKGTYSRKKKKIKTMNIKMTINSQLSTTESKRQKQNKLNKQLEEE